MKIIQLIWGDKAPLLYSTTFFFLMTVQMGSAVTVQWNNLIEKMHVRKDRFGV